MEIEISKDALNRMTNEAKGMAGWMKFIGIVSIIGGVLEVFTIVGIIIAWLPIWMGILLIQASSSITQAKTTGNPEHLVSMMSKLKTFFIISGILVIICIIIGIISAIVALISVIFAGAALAPYMR